MLGLRPAQHEDVLFSSTPGFLKGASPLGEDEGDRHGVEQREREQPRGPLADQPVRHIGDEAREDDGGNRKYPSLAPQQFDCQRQLQYSVYEQPDDDEPARRVHQSLRTMPEHMDDRVLGMHLQFWRRDPDQEVVNAAGARDGDGKARNGFNRPVNTLDCNSGKKRETQTARLRHPKKLLRCLRFSEHNLSRLVYRVHHSVVNDDKAQPASLSFLAREFRISSGFSRAAVCAIAALCALLIAPGVQADPAGTLSEIRFAEYSRLSSNLELARRMLTPLEAAQIPAALARTGSKLSDQPVNLAEETFALYVPARQPAGGYALLVFVPPWDAARLPDGWGPVLDRYGVIFVSAARSGNDASVLGRRDPLAILAEQNLIRRYHIDAQRMYVAGFSGGSRVALKLALACPDLFRGAILNAGSDPIGTAALPLPPRDLFLRFQESTHLVYVTGGRDSFHVTTDFASMNSLRDLCVFAVDDQPTAFADHEVIDSAALARALDTLAKPAPPDAGKLATCRSGIDAQLDAKLAHVQSLVAAGNREAAHDLLKDIDVRYGGLAAPRSLELAEQLDTAPIRSGNSPP